MLFLKVIKNFLPWLSVTLFSVENILTSVKEFRITNSLRYLLPLINLKPELENN